MMVLRIPEYGWADPHFTNLRDSFGRGKPPPCPSVYALLAMVFRCIFGNDKVLGDNPLHQGLGGRMKLELPLECPTCKHQMKLPVEEMRPGSTRRCAKCGTEFRFSGDDGRKTQKALDDLSKSLKNITLKL